MKEGKNERERGGGLTGQNHASFQPVILAEMSNSAATHLKDFHNLHQSSRDFQKFYV